MNFMVAICCVVILINEHLNDQKNKQCVLNFGMAILLRWVLLPNSFLLVFSLWKNLHKLEASKNSAVENSGEETNIINESINDFM